MRHGIPQFASMQPYIPAEADLENVAHYIRNTLKKVVDMRTLTTIRRQWKGKLIIKGILTAEDAKRASRRRG